MHALSDDDRRFEASFSARTVAPAEFTHKAHLRLAYVFLAQDDVDVAHGKIRDAIGRFLAHHQIDPAKYHETLTRAWLLAVRHFMDRAGNTDSAEAFLSRSSVLLDPSVMLSHYSKEVLYSPTARASFVEPDLDPIPQQRPDRGPGG